MPPTFLAPLAPALLVWHAAAGTALLGLATLNAVRAVARWRGQAPADPPSSLAGWTAAAYLAAAAVGLTAYPTYRVAVRARYLDHLAPWASNLFDLKENLVALGLPLALAAWVVARGLDAGNDRRAIAFHATCSVLAAFFVWVAAAIGVATTSLRSL